MSNQEVEHVYGINYLSAAYPLIERLSNESQIANNNLALINAGLDPDMTHEEELNEIDQYRNYLMGNIEKLLFKASRVAEKKRDYGQQHSVMTAYLDYLTSASSDSSSYKPVMTAMDIAPNVPIIINKYSLPSAGVVVNPVEFRLYRKIIEEADVPNYPSLTFMVTAKLYRPSRVARFDFDERSLSRSAIGSLAINHYLLDLQDNNNLPSKWAIKHILKGFNKIYPPLGFDVKSDLVGEIKLA